MNIKADTAITEMTAADLQHLIRNAVQQALLDLLDDPDKGLALRPEIEEQLLTSLERTQAGERGIPVEQVAAELGLDW